MLYVLKPFYSLQEKEEICPAYFISLQC